MSEEEKKAIECGKELVDLYDRYGLSITYTEGGYDVIKTLLNLIEKQQHIIEGKDCVIETQAHNEEVLMDYFNRHTCLHCGKGKLGYCEECYQKLIAENAKLQKELNEENLRCAKYAVENNDLKEKNEEASKKYSELIKKCTDKEWQHCKVEKMGCEGCYYDKEGDKDAEIN